MSFAFLLLIPSLVAVGAAIETGHEASFNVNYETFVCKYELNCYDVHVVTPDNLQLDSMSIDLMSQVTATEQHASQLRIGGMYNLTGHRLGGHMVGFGRFVLNATGVKLLAHLRGHEVNVTDIKYIALSQEFENLSGWPWLLCGRLGHAFVDQKMADILRSPVKQVTKFALESMPRQYRLADSVTFVDGWILRLRNDLRRFDPLVIPNFNETIPLLTMSNNAATVNASVYNAGIRSLSNVARCPDGMFRVTYANDSQIIHATLCFSNLAARIRGTLTTNGDENHAMRCIMTNGSFVTSLLIDRPLVGASLRTQIKMDKIGKPLIEINGFGAPDDLVTSFLNISEVTYRDTLDRFVSDSLRSVASLVGQKN